MFALSFCNLSLDERVALCDTCLEKSIFKMFCSMLFVSGLLVSGFVVFAPKFVESHFGVTAAWAAQLIGILTN